MEGDALEIQFVEGADASGAGGMISGGPGRSMVGITAGVGQAVYEVVDSAPLSEQEVEIPIWINREGVDATALSGIS